MGYQQAAEASGRMQAAAAKRASAVATAVVFNENK